MTESRRSNDIQSGEPSSYVEMIDGVVKKTYFSIPLLKCFFAELLGTFLLVFIGDGAIAQFVLSKDMPQEGTFLSVNFGYALALMIAIYVSGGVSGGHVNPAVSLAMSTLGRLRWVALPVYWAAQFLGAFVGAVLVYAVYVDGINNLEGGRDNRTDLTAGIFATYPAPFLTLGEGFVDQVAGTALLMGGIMAAFDKHNTKPPKGMEPMLVGFVLLAIGLAYGLNFGYALNPARDFSPRVFSAMVGYGKQVWILPSGDHFWWIPILGPLVGAILGAWIYYLAIEVHHKKQEERSVAADRAPLTENTDQ